MISLEPLQDMTDDFGMIQFSKFDKPDITSGYTIDDVARALIVSSNVQKHEPENQIAKELTEIYLNFMKHCQLPSGRFHNVLDENKKFQDDVGSPDSQGRSIWGLAEAYGNLPKQRERISPMLIKSIQSLEEFPPQHPITEAFILLGLTKFYESSGQARKERASGLIKKISSSHIQRVETHSDSDWYWSSDKMTYENARSPQALFRTHQITGDKSILECAEKLTKSLGKVTFKKGILHPIGSDGWYKKGDIPAKYDQQPVDAGAMVELYRTAFEVTGKPHYKQLARDSLDWFHGKNSEKIPIVSPNARVYDGLKKGKVNLNQGAESQIAYNMAQLSL